MPMTVHSDPHGVLALIPARGGSKSVPKKNIRLFRGHPLIAYSIAAAKLSQKISRIIVSTDSEEIADIARKYGAETPFLRPAEYAHDLSPDIEFVNHSINWLEKHEGRVPEYLIHLRPTSPIRDPVLIDEAIERIMADPDSTSLRSVHVCKHTPYKWLTTGKDNYMKPVFPGITMAQTNGPRQEFPETLVPNGYVDVLKASYINASGEMHGVKAIGYRTDEVLDIDTEGDLKELEAFHGQRKEIIALREYLDRAVRKHP